MKDRVRASFDEAAVSELFHENTKVAPYENGDDPAWLPEPLAPGNVLSRFPLPKVAPRRGAELEETIHRRQTLRAFNPWAALPPTLLSRLLAFSCGYTTPVAFGGVPHIAFRRAAPSAGATYPIEVYPVILHVAGLPAGVYHYAVNDHSLELLRPGRFHRALAAWTLHQPYIADTAAVFVLAGFPERICPRYGERGYRYMLLEAGHIAQNLYLLATSYGLGVLSNGGFVDTAINCLVGLNDRTEIALYTVAVGVLRQRPPGGD